MDSDTMDATTADLKQQAGLTRDESTRLQQIADGLDAQASENDATARVLREAEKQAAAAESDAQSELRSAR